MVKCTKCLDTGISDTVTFGDPPQTKTLYCGCGIGGRLIKDTDDYKIQQSNLQRKRDERLIKENAHKARWSISEDKKVYICNYCKNGFHFYYEDKLKNHYKTCEPTLGG